MSVKEMRFEYQGKAIRLVSLGKLILNRRMTIKPIAHALIFCLGAFPGFSATKVIDDIGMKVRFQKGLEGLVEGKDKRITSLAELNKQLNRKKAKIAIPEKKPSRFRPDEIYERCKSSVLMIGRIYKCDKCTKWHVGSASAFAITSDGIIATNYHVVENKDGATLGAMDLSGKTYAVSEVLAASKADDVAILRLKGAKLTPLPLAGEAAPVGTAVNVISHPDGRYFTMTKGDVSRYYLSRAKNMTAPRMAITADYAKGSSGAPVLNSEGEVVGMVSATNSIYYTKVKGQNQNLQMVIKSCIPVAAINKLLN
jgi:serine protease Do